MKANNARIKRDYKNCSKPKLMSRGNNVFAGMSSSPLFPAPPLPLSDLKQNLDNLETAMTDAQHGDRLKSSVKNAVAITVIDNLDKMANYVESIANGDDAIILAAGFAVSYKTANKTTIGAIENFIVENGPNSGEVTISISKTIGAISYSYYYGIDDGDKTIWFDVPDSKTSIVISNLTPGKTYAFRVTAVGTRGKKSQSDIIRKVVF